MSLNVLIVDDSAVMRAMVVKTLRATGLPIGDVYEAANGREGLDTLEKHWIDLVFADINMPVMNGEEMIDRIRDNPVWQDLAVIVVSTEGSRTRIERLERKDTTFIHKPFTAEAVRDAVNELAGVKP